MPPPRISEGGGTVTNLILKLGIAKTATQANVVLLVIAVIAVGLTIYLLIPNRPATPTVPPTGTFAEPGTFP